MGGDTLKTKPNYLPALLVIFTILLTGCSTTTINAKDYEEIPSMLNVLTNKIQLAVEDGHFAAGEKALMEHMNKAHPNILKWFDEHGYTVKADVKSGRAVVMICDGEKPLFEDTNCAAGKPDKDHRNSTLPEPCIPTMSANDVAVVCQ
jgi:hypothetical protein